MKRNIWLATVLLAFTLAAASGVRADGIFTASLAGSNEVPPTGSVSTGFISVTVTGDNLFVFESFTSLSTPADAAHIHCCADAGINAPVALPFINFPTVTSGSYMKNFDLTLLGTYTVGFVTSSGGTAAGAEAALINALFGGKAYSNIHDVNFPAGEIRGQLIQSTTSTTPEPGTMLLVGMGLAGLAGWKKRRAA